MKLSRKQLRRLIESVISKGVLNERPQQSITQNHPMIKELETLFKKAGLVLLFL